MSNRRLIYGFHAVNARLWQNPKSLTELYALSGRHDTRMQQALEKAAQENIPVHFVEAARLDNLCRHARHQGIAGFIDASHNHVHLDDVLDNLTEPPLLLILDGITDPHNLGACLRVADGAGVHAVIAPRDHAAGISATVAKVASGAAETVPYFMVTNLARTLGELKERGIWVTGTAGEAQKTLYEADFASPAALVLGAEGAGLRQLTRRSCDELVRIPMRGAVESLNVSVASGICLYEALRQRGG